MSYELVNIADHCIPAAATAQSKQAHWRGTLSTGPWDALRGWLAATFRRPATAAKSPDQPAPPDWDRRLRRDVLRIEARRIL